jgi:hypothetical protein
MRRCGLTQCNGPGSIHLRHYYMKITKSAKQIAKSTKPFVFLFVPFVD